MYRPFSALLAATTLILLAALGAAAARADGVSDAEFAQLVQAVRHEPGGMVRHRSILERLSAPQMAQAIAATGNSHFTWLYPMVLRAQDFPALNGVSVSQLSLVAVHDERLVPIPFQVDEFDTRGLVYIPGTTLSNPLVPGFAQRERKPDGVAGRYDRGDELVFMYRDGGLRRASADELAKLPGKVLGLVRIKRDNLAPRYVYLLEGQPLRSRADYVDIDLPRGTARTSVADIAWDPSSMAKLKSISPRVGPSSGKNIVDGVYGEVSTGLVQKNLRFSLNTTDNIRIQPVAVRDGPVRALILAKVRIFYLGLPVYHDFVNAALYEQGGALLARVRLDSLDSAKYFVNLIKEPRIEATIDFANLEGAEVRWQVVHDAPDRALVDGRMGDIEKRMNGVSMPGDWLWMDSRRGWQFFFSNNFSLEPDGLLHEFLGGMETRMVYEDGADLVRKGERIPGAGPRFGVRTRGIPVVATTLLTSLRGVDMDKLRGIEDLVDQLIRLDEKGKLDRLNRVINETHRRLIARGRIRTLDDLADLLVRDVRRLGFRPADQEKLVRLARRAILEGGNLEDYRLGRVLKVMKRVAQEEGFDFDKLQFAMLDNALWFPDSVGEAGPAAFDREVRNPPVAELLPP
ncbi:MAG: hypothetical protein ACLGHJ_03065 [Gammaproteobacteria bacterium]